MYLSSPSSSRKEDADEMVGIDEMIALNQMAQGLWTRREREEWFAGLDVQRQRDVLNWAVEMAKQARASELDVSIAVKESGLKPTYTPCVMLSRPPIKSQYFRVLELPQEEWQKLLAILIALFAVANRRRLRKYPENKERHWWNWDLSDPEVLARIRELANGGRL